MIYITVFLGILFIAFGFIYYKDDPVKLISGYQELTLDQQTQVDASGFARYFRRFHWILGTIVLIGGLLLYVFAPSILGNFISFVPLIGYLLFIARTGTYFGAVQRGLRRTALVVMIIVTTGVGVLTYFGGRLDRVKLLTDELKISGIYSVDVAYSNITQISAVDSLPTISSKKHGFATPPIFKGVFKNANNSTVHLVIQGKYSPILRIQRLNEPTIYYNHPTLNIDSLVREIKLHIQ